MNRYTVEIDWAWGHASGTATVTLDAPKLEDAIKLALAQNGPTNVVTEGGAGIREARVRYTPSEDLTETDDDRDGAEF